MEAADRNSRDSVVDQDIEDVAAAFGITRVPVDYFHYKEFRYTQLADAIAEARREESRERPSSAGQR